MQQATTVGYYAEHYANNPQIQGFVRDAGLLHQILEVTKLPGTLDTYQLKTLRCTFRRTGEEIIVVAPKPQRGKVQKATQR